MKPDPTELFTNALSSNPVKRSKSLGASDARSVEAKLKNLPKDCPDLDAFSGDNQENLKLAVEDPNQLQSRTLMELVKTILERVVEGIRYSEPGAKVRVIYEVSWKQYCPQRTHIVQMYGYQCHQQGFFIITLPHVAP